MLSEAVEPRYQPVVRIADGSAVGFEALLRWREGGDGALHTPEAIQEAFHDFELASGIGRLLRDRAFADMAGWHARGLALLPVSIRVAPAELLGDDFAGELFLALDRHGIPPRLVQVVVAGNTLLERGADMVARTLRLLSYGDVRVALDDFGVGPFSFADVHRYPVGGLGIAPGYVQRMVADPQARAIVEAICRLGPILQVEVSAKGIACKEQRAMLDAMGCPTGSGPLFPGLLDADAAAALLLRDAHAP